MYYVLDAALHGLVLLNPFVVGNIVIRHVDEEIGIYWDGLPCLGGGSSRTGIWIQVFLSLLLSLSLSLCNDNIIYISNKKVIHVYLEMENFENIE